LTRDLSSTLNNLGVAYSTQAELGVEQIANLDLAITAYKKAAQILRDAGLTRDLSSTLNNLGNAYLTQAEQDGRSEPERRQYQQKAIEYFVESLQGFDPKMLPVDCLKTARNLGNLGFKEGMWDIAIQGYSKAIEAVEQTRSWATNDDRRAEIHAQAIEIYTNIVQAFVNLEQYDKAIEYAERSRSQRIVDLLHTNDLYPQGNIPEEVQQLLAAFQAKQSAIDILLQQLANGDQRQSEAISTPRHRAITESLSTELKQLEAEKQAIWKELRNYDPVLAGQVKVDALPFAKMQQLLANQPHTAILYFYTTSAATLVFVVQANSIALHQCLDQGTDAINDFLFQQWLEPYRTNKTQWREQMPSVLADLTERLKFDQLLSQHIPTHIQELIIVPHLFLHQIPFAALPLDPSNSPRSLGEGLGVRAKYLSDRYRLRIVSSLQILQYCSDRAPITTQTYATVEDATNDLPFAGFEGNQVAQMFNVPRNRRLKGNTEATKTNYRHLLETSNSLLSCHHAKSRIDKPLESRLQLGDGFIALDELLMSRYPQLNEVFLSCCETGLGAPKDLTDDILTLATGFLCAGARSVISSLWSVDDLATALFSILYHQSRQAGIDRPTAIYQAQTQLRALQGKDLGKGKPIRRSIEQYLNQKLETLGNSPEQLDARLKLDRLLEIQLPYLAQQPFPFESPFYWAGFMCQGLA